MDQMIVGQAVAVEGYFRGPLGSQGERHAGMDTSLGAVQVERS